MSKQFISNSYFVSDTGSSYRPGQYLTLFEYNALTSGEYAFVDVVEDRSFEGLGVDSRDEL